MFCRCPQQYYRRYICGEVIPPGIAMLQGSAVHTAAKTNFSQKLVTKRDLPTADIIDAAVTDFVQQTAVHGVKYTGSDKDTVVSLASAHATVQAPTYQPDLVEHKVVTPLTVADTKYELISILDLVAADTVVDLKTTSRRYTEDAAAKSIQLAAYAYAYNAAFAKKPKALKLDVLISGSRDVSRQELYATPDDDWVVRMFLRRAEALAHATKTGSFPPCDPTSWVCNPKWCGYYATCPYVR